ncbi:MAG: IgGFc-binding protein [Myxococcales bacterium]|nr:IgGFc-binding protein [Myxococcales bacterium]
MDTGTSSSPQRRAITLTGLVVGLTACGSDEPPPGPGQVVRDAAVDGASGDGFPDDGGGDSGSDQCRTCSDDLHSVIDCETKAVVSTCGQGLGCGPEGTCVPACESANGNQSSIGCEFYTFVPYSSAGRSCIAAFVNNVWDEPVEVTIEFDGRTIPGKDHAYIPKGQGDAITYEPLPDGRIPEGEMAIVFLSDEKPAPEGALACPVEAAITGGEGLASSIAVGKAFRISTSAPTAAYDIFPFGGAETFVTSATLLLPTSVWGTNYIGVTPYQDSKTRGLTLVAKEDTQITILPTADIKGSQGVPSATAGTAVVYSLAKGNFLNLLQGADLSGSVIESDRPIGLWAQHWAMKIPVNVGHADGAHQQIPPVHALGHEYVAVRYRNRGSTEEVVPWRIVAAVDGTELTFDPPQPGVATTLAQGEVLVFDSAGPFVVRSQGASHPFYAAAHMTGKFMTDAETGDPEMVNLIPPSQFLPSYVFFADPTYANTNLVMVRAKGTGGFADVTLDCAGVLDGWKPVGGDGAYEYTRIDLRRDGAKVGQCDNGRHEISSKAPFGLVVWGFDDAVSYAYPGGAGARPVNTVKVPTVL